MLTEDMASDIVEKTMVRLNRNINIMNNKGIIIGSGNKNRINQAHSGAIEVLKTGKPLIISEDDLEKWEGTLPGINLPITFQNLVIGVIGITGDPKEIMEFGELVKMITEMMIQQSFMIEQTEWKQRLRELIFEELLKSKQEEESISQKLQLIDVTLAPPYHTALIELGPNQLKRNDFLRFFEDIFDQEQSLIGFYSVNRIFLLCSNLEEAKFSKKLEELLTIARGRVGIRIGWGLSVHSYKQIRRSFKEAQQALEYGSKDENLVFFSDIIIKSLLAKLDDRTKHQYFERVTGNLSDKLLETLDQFFKHNQNIGKCAKAMYLHRNSLVYRMKKIKELTGYDPQIFSDAVILQLAVWLYQLRQ